MNIEAKCLSRRAEGRNKFRSDWRGRKRWFYMWVVSSRCLRVRLGNIVLPVCAGVSLMCVRLGALNVKIKQTWGWIYTLNVFLLVFSSWVRFFCAKVNSVIERRMWIEIISLKRWSRGTYRHPLMWFDCGMNAIRPRSEASATSIVRCWSQPAPHSLQRCVFWRWRCLGMCKCLLLSRLALSFQISSPPF